jgi:uncharacterized protein (DUF58 family)
MSPWARASRALGLHRPGQRLRQWWAARHAPVDSLTLNQHNVYILPTRAGFMLGLTLAVLLVGAINYQLNLGYLLTFLLAGAALAAMHVSHANLRQINLRLIAPDACFMGASARFDIQIRNPSRRPRLSLGVRPGEHGAWAWCNVGAQAEHTLQLAFAPARRGWQRLPLLTLESLYPLGTFRVWSLWQPATPVCVYPQPEADPPALPLGAVQARGRAHAHTSTSGEPDELRPYRRGDPLKHMAWKKVAQTGQLVSREPAHAFAASHLWLDAATCGLHPFEAQLSRLCAWALHAHAQGLHYGLRVAGQEVAPGSGPQHLAHCLRTLALA